MSETTVTKAKRKTNTEFIHIADQLLADMKKLEELMQIDRAEIERLKAESARLESDNRLVLTRLKAMW